MSPFTAVTNKLREDTETRTRMVYAWELPSIMRKHILTGAMGSIYFVLFTGMYLVTLGNAIGLRYWQWGLLSAASSFALVFQLVAAFLVSRTGSRRLLWYGSAMLSRILRATAVALAFGLSPHVPSAARIVFIGLLVIANVFDAIAAPPWMSWLADIIPEDQHGSFMGRRSAWIALANMCALVPIGYGIDKVPEGMKIPALMLVFAFAFTVGILDLVIHKTIPEPRMAPPPRRHFWSEVKAPLMDVRFRPWLIFNGCWTFSMTLGGSLGTIYFVENLGIKSNFMGGSIVLVMLPMLGTMLAGRFLGQQVDRRGIKQTLTWGYRFWAILPAFWILAKPSTALWWLAASAITGSLASLLALTSSTKLITRLPPAAHVSMYVAVSTCVGSIAGGMGSLVGGLILHVFEGASWKVGSYTFVGFHAIFVSSLILRNLATLLMRRIEEPHARAGTAPTNPAQAPAD